MTVILFRIAAWASLLFSVAAAMLWARSADHRDQVYHVRPGGRGWAIGLVPGALAVLWSPYLGAARTEYVGRPAERFPVEPFTPTVEAWGDRTGAYWRAAGLVYHSGETGGRHTVFRFRLFVLPFWLLVTVAALPSVLWSGLRSRRRRRGPPARAAGRAACPHCGYDLRATPAQCPECGQAPVGHLPAASPPPS